MSYGNEDVKVRRISRGKNFEVSFIDGDVFKCKSELVKQVASQIPDITPEEIAPILVRIQAKARKNSSQKVKLNFTIEDCVGKVLKALLGVMDCEGIREVIENLTIQETEELFNAEDPLEVLDTF